jgi:hypothetical protein
MADLDFSVMNTRLFSCFILSAALALTACPSNPKKNQKKPGVTQDQPTPANEADANADFRAFLGHLRKVVQARDLNTLASMMTPNFAYVLGATAAQDRIGPGVFQYWDENALWIELEGILSERFVPKENYMVAPPQFADPAADYTGYRAGIQRVNGTWKFAYFVNG